VPEQPLEESNPNSQSLIEASSSLASLQNIQDGESSSISSDRPEGELYPHKRVDFWYGTAKNILRVYLTLFIRKVWVTGKENITPGPKIIVANHDNATDAFVLPFIFTERLYFFIQSETFTLPFFGKIMKLADQIPVVIGRGREAIKMASERLSMGYSVVIFPEGHLNHAERLRRAGAGAAMVAMKTGMPILPVGFFVPPTFVRGIRSHHYNRDTFGRWQFGGQCYVQIGKLWQPFKDLKVEGNYRQLRQVTEEMMTQVSALMQQAVLESGASRPPESLP